MSGKHSGSVSASVRPPDLMENNICPKKLLGLMGFDNLWKLKEAATGFIT